MLWIILLSKLLGDYNFINVTLRQQRIILLSKLLGDYNLGYGVIEILGIILLSKSLGGYNFLYLGEINYVIILLLKL